MDKCCGQEFSNLLKESSINFHLSPTPSVISPSNKFHQLEMDEIKLCVLGSAGMVKKK
jgi:hypothetical protein